jgi:DNA-binding transcriptional MerR regulator
MMSEPQPFSLAELAEKAGLPGRTIRYYIARGLLPGPLKAGRDAAYGVEHLERLRIIGRLQAEGLTLLEIARRLSGEPSRMPVPEATPWWQYRLAEDVIVTVRADASPWRLKQIRKCLAQMAAGLREPENN